jgi:hypothetical protein
MGEHDMSRVLDLTRDFVIAAGGALGGAIAVFVGQEVVARWHRPVLDASFDANANRSL